MWFNQPTYNSYVPSGYSYQGFDDPYARAIARERAAREREAAARHAELLHRQRTRDAARSPYNHYLSDYGNSFVSYPYAYRPHTNPYPIYEDPTRRPALEQQRQLELTRQAELNRRREEEGTRGLEERSDAPQQRGHTFTSSPHFSVPISSPGESPSTSPHTIPTQLPKSPPPPPSPEPTTLEAIPEQIRAAMTIQEFYRSRVAR
jgi:hypothetical protein